MALTRLGLNQSINLASNTTGTLAVANGGTGLTSGTADQFLKFTGTTTVASSALSGVGKIGQVIQSVKTSGQTISSGSYVAVSSLTANITCSATSSKVLVMISMPSMTFLVETMKVVIIAYIEMEALNINLVVIMVTQVMVQLMLCHVSLLEYMSQVLPHSKLMLCMQKKMETQI